MGYLRSPNGICAEIPPLRLIVELNIAMSELSTKESKSNVLGTTALKD